MKSTTAIPAAQAKPAPAKYWTKYSAPLRKRGYAPIPIKVGDKRPIGGAWPVRDTSREKHPRAGVGIVTTTTPTLDIDLRDPKQISIALDVVKRSLNGTRASIRRRIGAKGCAIPFRLIGEPFTKLQFYLDPACTKKGDPKIELLAEGQQFVAYHIHPDTGRDYLWPDGELLDIDYADLPALDAASALKLMQDIAVALGVAHFTAPPPAPVAQPVTLALMWPGDRVKVPGLLAALDPNMEYDAWCAVGKIGRAHV